MAVNRTLVIGGSGFVSGAIARTALNRGHDVWIVTRGEKPIPGGVQAITADRKDARAFAEAIQAADTTWDLVVDCIGYEPEDARQDVELFPGKTGHFVFISTDFVFDPARRLFPQPFDNPYFLDGTYGGKKRQCELEIINGDTGTMAWTIFRPCHIYGPGSELGCLPLHGRDPELIAKIRAGDPLKLIGGGHFLQQPIFVRDLAELVLSAQGNDYADQSIYCSVGPDIIESRRYYEIIGDILGCPVTIEELPVGESLARQPELAPFLCHRIYDLAPLRLDGLRVPNTPIEAGLREHVESMI